MKVAQLAIDDKPIMEVVVTLDPWEAKQAALAMQEFAAKRPKSKKLAKLSESFEIASIFY